MFRSYQAGDFDPDASAVDRVLQAASAWTAQGIELESDLSDEEEQNLLESCPQADLVPCNPRELFPNLEAQEAVVRKKSGIAHCLQDETATMCGRHLSLNYAPLLLLMHI